jgi:acetyl esterase/lipase
VLYKTKLPEGLTESSYTITGFQDAPLRLLVIKPAGHTESLPALVYFHGGAFAVQALPYLKRTIAAYALQTPCTVIFVDYHLLPKATFPTGLEDCAAGYQWVVEHADTFGIDRARIAVGGDSAGGALAIGTCLLARERHFQMPCFQMLIYPVTDERQTTESMKEYTDVPLWHSKVNAKMWHMYLSNGLPIAKYYASPAEAASLVGMPPSYIEVAEYDCLRDEGVQFAEALRNDGVPVDLCRTSRTIHGFEMAEHSKIVHQSIMQRAEKLKIALSINV